MESAASLSQASSNGLMPPPDLSQPTTPQQTQASLPDSSVSPTLPSSPGPAMTKARYSSPAPPRTSSTTPPPSSQLPCLLPASNRPEAWTPGSPTPQLESPPPTDRLLAQPGPVSEASSVLFSNEEIAAASPDDLRSMVDKLATALRSANMSAAHYRLQFNMACVESEEAQKRMQVELEMAQREVEVLQEADRRRRDSTVELMSSTHDSAITAQNALMINELTRQGQLLQAENESLREELVMAQRMIQHQDDEMRTVLNDNRNLRERIRKNREHFNSVMHLAGVDQSPPYSTLPSPITQRNQSAKRGTINSANPGQQPFEALLLADKIISQETATAPSTPTRSVPRKNPFGHNRGTHSLSSLPSTPNRARPVQSDIFSTPPGFHAVNHAAVQAITPQHKRARRESSDSTITATSGGDNDHISEEKEVPESQAASAASSMLRRTPQSSFEGGAVRKSGVVQTKLFGHVRKPGVSRPMENEKKRVGSSSTPRLQSSPAKKGRVGDSIGLGIVEGGKV